MHNLYSYKRERLISLTDEDLLNDLSEYVPQKRAAKYWEYVNKEGKSHLNAMAKIIQEEPDSLRVS